MIKVAGTKDGITAIQLDIKAEGLEHKIMVEALERAVELGFTRPKLLSTDTDLDSLPDDTLVKIEVGAIGGEDNATFTEIFDICVNEDDPDETDDVDGCGFEIEEDDITDEE